jgi:hypothetical protein
MYLSEEILCIDSFVLAASKKKAQAQAEENGGII